MTDIRAPRRRFLPLLGADTVRHGTTSHTTCFYKCGNACDRPVPNRTDNPTFASVVQTAVSRRNVLKAAGASALVVAAGPALPAAASDRPRHHGGSSAAGGAR
ncbi:twin-arginine translocation signal domain-containing protein [Geodermatophilus sp. URMC 61]|uniref:twin-arginine translocation signal domain-containing protein n=1 Tax=Geodermatophilus sp. URMC 61 TaxID=3423411 RepID=UPI00406C04C2